jgi:hypothetical protein
MLAISRSRCSCTRMYTPSTALTLACSSTGGVVWDT